MDNFLRCDTVVGLAGRLFDGAVDPGRRELVEMHLLVCPPCLDHLRKLDGVRAALSTLPGRPAPARLLGILSGPAV
ncbi:zf-HC2 domain-containing protein [Micromonospora sp. WMMA1363]|uniref:anti-sigma factor family protein n=1 Tax=Micromonospora sp. WMMA1363 TaxID=3053985 RepID=UPI00259C815B|nr:zf-HC2 domain-containing protein [Micromonospora sp. WMMA1363]MDM4719625.1 zf-HC2 domain-containing protein [Micromonospora sp. WMMA1363]